METKGIEARGRGKREGGGGEGDCSEREEETKGIFEPRRRSVFTVDHKLMEPSIGLYLLQKRRSLVEGNECKRDLRTTEIIAKVDGHYHGITDHGFSLRNLRPFSRPAGLDLVHDKWS